MVAIKSQLKKNIKNEAGFTLLEILAVIVILGILAVVATPKYFDLQSKAKDKAMEASRAEAISRVNQYFAEQVLDGTPPYGIVYSNDSLDLANFGTDFSATVTSGGAAVDPDDENPPDIIITITAVAATDGGTLEGGAEQRVEIPRPGL